MSSIMAQVRRKDDAAVRRMLQENDQKKGLENFSPLTVKLPLLYAALGPCLYAATAAKPTPIGARVTVLRRSTSATLLLVACGADIRADVCCRLHAPTAFVTLSCLAGRRLHRTRSWQTTKASTTAAQ